MTTDSQLVEERTRKVLDLLNKNSYVKGFACTAGVALLFAILSYVGIIPVPGIHFIILAGICIAALVLCAYGKEKWGLGLLVLWPTWLGAYIRTRNLAGLRDVTTGGWTLGPDLDPFLFLRWSKYIVEHGSLMTLDVMRYIPLGFQADRELILLPYMMAWFHGIASWFGSVSVEHSAVLFPVVMFILTVPAFFFMNRAIFSDLVDKNKATFMAAIASVFLALLPSILPRTIAGIPEKEAAGFLFIFLGLGLFILAWKAKTRTMTFIYAALAGIVTGMMSLTWGGAIYITLTIAIATLAAYFLKRISMREYLAYLMWIVVHVAVMLPFTERFTLFGLLTSLNYIVILAPALLIIVHYLLEMPSVKPFWHKGFLTRLPVTVVAVALSVVIALVVGLVVAGPDLIMSRLISLKNIIFNPVAGRVNVTVAENRQPYFTEWIANFGPQFLGIWLGFWIAFVGFVCLGWYTLREFPQKARWTLLGSAVIFILAFIFSRYDGSSILNGSNFISYALLIIGFLVFAWMWGSYHWKGHHQEQFNTIPYSVLILGVFFFLALLSARSAIRLVMMLVPPVASALGFMVVESYSSLRGFFNDSSRTGKKSLFALVAALLILGSAYVALYDYRVSHATAESYVPSIYTTQWQKAMEWVRENTPTNAVFAHWWDYGYWVQSIGERATVLDGGNAIEYWNHLMGRYVLTGTVERDALEMLYAHNVTNLLIDSTEIGKYSAFSSIGSNKDYDRRSWISSFYRDESLTNELKNATSLVYRGGTLVDEDIVYTFNGTRVYLPSASVDGSAGAMVGAVIVVRNNDGSYGQARGVFVYNNKQYEIPLRYVFTQKGVQDFGTGVEAGPFFVPRITQDAQTGVQIDPAGSLLYMSNRTRNSMLAKLYLYNETIPGFRLVHTEKDPIIETIESQGVVIGDFADFQGFRGPIKIWEINYPADIIFEEKYISTIYPAEIAFA